MGLTGLFGQGQTSIEKVGIWELWGYEESAVTI